MSIKERPREKKEDKKEKSEDSKKINDWLDNVDMEKIENKTIEAEPKQETITKPENTVISPKVDEEIVITEIVEVAPVDIFLIKMPPWVKKPWMYVKPTHEHQLSSWLDSWQGLVLDYSRSYKIHIVNLSELNTKYPFTNQEIGKILTYDQLQTIIDKMVTEGLARWIDETKISARIYYLTNKDWASRVMAYLMESGYAAEVMTFFELQGLEQEWSTLPRAELRDIFDILVMDGRAKWVGEGKDTLSFIL
ncbi:MAG: hypothetical protein GPJ54_15835 [Candidatus Heimdallarchaeota archaeon]|nr:hypothetical protein [Candidatus Heimdallarchaeota archaeon]